MGRYMTRGRWDGNVYDKREGGMERYRIRGRWDGKV